MSAPEIIRELTETFAANLDAYKSGAFNEAQVRIQFINPMLEALGWDVSNRAGYAEAYKDVIHEDSLRIGGAVKAPDYCCRIGGARKFFIEAKKPSVNIKEDIHPAYQLRRYAWSAKLPLSILTDFEEFAVYDCRVRPAKNDKASRARILYIRFEEYVERWDEIAEVFTREAILKGSFDKYAASHKRRGTAEVDAAFLAEIEHWREELAKNIALRNAALSQRELNHAVQQTIDRIIFLRIAEDRGIEDYGRLMALQNGGETYRRMLEIFHAADARYNSGLFHFGNEKGRAGFPDEITPNLAIDDKALKPILASLYYPDSPYEFSVLPADILGQVYEQFLGKVIRLTAGHRAVVEDKPEVKKAGGVYYTPTYIVNYIVEHTVGRLLEGKTPRQATKLSICDPACGSGSFLLGAYQYLLDWHLKWYADNEPEKWSKGREPKIFQFIKDEYRLTTTEKKRILLNNIYGVDIDAQAVEVTKLSLLLKVLENETQDTLGRQMAMFHERALPDLGHNIKCGNSLIGPDFYDQQELALLDDDARQRINVFDWQAEFPAIFTGKSPGFDAIIGNPPYIRIQTMQDSQAQEVEFFGRSYKAASKGNYDIYVIFVERGLSLLGGTGKLGFILPNKFFNAQYGQPLRNVLSGGKHLEHIVHFGDQQVFPTATTYTCLLFLGSGTSRACDVIKVSSLESWRCSGVGERDKFQANTFAALEWNIEIGAKGALRSRLPKLGKPLGETAQLFVGLQTSADKVFVLPNRSQVESEILRPFLTTGGICAYQPAQANSWMIFPYEISDGKAMLIPSERMKNDFPKAWAYLKSHEDKLRERDRGKWNHDQWYAFGRSQNLAEMDEEKLVIQVTAIKPTVILDSGGLCMTGGGAGPFYGIRPFSSAKFGIKFLLGILNSKVFGWIVRTQSTPLRGGYFKFSKQYIETSPIPQPDKATHNRMVELVERMLGLHKQLAGTKDGHAKTMLQRQIDATDRQIDRLVYELYGLTDEEVSIIEQAAT